MRAYHELLGSERVRLLPTPRVAGFAGLLAFVTFNVGWIAGDAVQPAAFSTARHDISDLGAASASSAWLYDRLAANASGALVVVLALGLWRALAPSRLGRLGAIALAVAGVGTFLDGIFRLDCQAIDAACSNDSWQSHAHKLESSVTVAATLVAVVLLALAFRRLPRWHGAWIPTIATIPAIFVANAAFSVFGAGAATRAGTVVVLAGFAFLGLTLMRSTAHRRVDERNSSVVVPT
jgi:uncharacterized protein DUF998